MHVAGKDNSNSTKVLRRNPCCTDSPRINLFSPFWLNSYLGRLETVADLMSADAPVTGPLLPSSIQGAALDDGLSRAKKDGVLSERSTISVDATVSDDGSPPQSMPIVSRKEKEPQLDARIVSSKEYYIFGRTKTKYPSFLCDL